MTEPRSRLHEWLRDDALMEWGADGIAAVRMERLSPALQANADFFGHPVWGAAYFEYENQSPAFARRWRAATGSWDGKIVVDLGCGPGNLYRCVAGSPEFLIGVDISRGALHHARLLGYEPLLADVQDLPLTSGFADVVALNATLHHCEDVGRVLSEAARLVKPGGLLVTDEDPLLGGPTHAGLGDLAFRLRSKIPVVRIRDHPTRRLRYVSAKEREARWRTEIHRNKAGDEGVSAETFHELLEPLGFAVRLYPHKHVADERILAGERGESSLRARATQRLSGIDPDAEEAELSVLCIALRE